MEKYQIIIVGLVLFIVALIVVVMFLAFRNGKSRKNDHNKIKTITEANYTQQKLIYLLKSRSA